MLLVYVLIIAVFPCIYYSIHLVAIHACKHIPQHINTFLHNIFSFHSKNPETSSFKRYTTIYENCKTQVANNAVTICNQMANIISLCAQNIKSIKNFIQCFFSGKYCRRDI